MEQFIDDLGVTAAWLGTSFLLMGLGFIAVDLLTPGKLRAQVSENLNAGLLVGGKMIAVSIIIFSAVWTAPDTLSDGLTEAVLYSLLGLVFSAIAFIIVDVVLPADLRRLVEQREFDPAICVAVGAEIGLAIVIAAAIS